ncbi:acyltransferase family protein [Alteromonas sp. ASW11-130]|uniref:acyltransferase family protein n=1 Tax=Alteromonas sp. ASW11-130 TaxID=3015775 RepID=UPI0022426D8A|nr:acyltransferase family protein [Alteromonas sp. ASW11-130]MCW8091297.1 acyltransferase [Alteromonas sp. ASW11-130]
MRQDIQFLRGIAVLYVVIYHSGLSLLPQGFLGVDIFFVISGFLITKLILERLDKNCFSFSDFYYRRARRLLPALYSTLIFTSLFSIFFLTSIQLNDYVDQFIGALTFSANMVLPGQTGYFESEAEGKPLLHIWSLSLEEQYYFLLPLFLFLLPKRFRISGLIIVTIISAVWCFMWVSSSNQEAPFLWRIGYANKYEWAFYLLPTRAWELLAGSICAWLYLNRASIKIPQFIKYLSLFIILLIGVIQLTPSHPGVESVIVVIATSILLLGKDGWLPKSPVITAIEKVGDWSYSIYLVHWPLFAFAFLSFVGNVPSIVGLVLIFLSIFLGYCQFRYVETPFRYKEFRYLFKSWKGIASISLVIAIIPLSLSSHPLYDDYADKISEIRKVNYGLDKECEDSFEDDDSLKPVCQNSNTIDTVVWGDSYAMHLVPGLVINNKNIAQITKSSCGPFLGIAAVNPKLTRQWAQECIAYNERALQYIINTDSVKTVVMSSPIRQYLFEDHQILSEDGLTPTSSSVLIEAYKKGVLALSKSGKKAIFISPPPEDGTNIGECLERKYGPALIFKDNCSISKQAYLTEQKAVLKVMEAFSRISKVILLDEYLCDESACKTEFNDTFIYRDDGHLSVDGSKIILSGVNLAEF